MRSVALTGLLAFTLATTAYAAESTAPNAATTKSTTHTAKKKTAAKKATKTTKTTKGAKQPEQMSEAKRRDLERRIEALEQKYEMQYRETDSPTGAPGAKPAAH